MKYNKNLSLFLTAVLIMSMPIVASAASDFIKINSVGRFEYDSDKDGKADVVLDSADVNALNQESANQSSDISDLQARYVSLCQSFDNTNNTLSSALSSGDAVPEDIENGKTALSGGILITGTRTLSAQTQGTATAYDITFGKTAWVNGTEITGNGETYSHMVSGEVANGATSGSITATGKYHLIVASQLYATSSNKVTDIKINGVSIPPIDTDDSTMYSVAYDGAPGDVITLTRNTGY